MTAILHNILASATTCTTSSCAIVAKQLPLSSWKETFQTPFQQQSLTFATTFSKFPLPPSQTRLCALDHPCATVAHSGLELDMSFTTWSFNKVPLPYSSHSVQLIPNGLTCIVPCLPTLHPIHMKKLDGESRMLLQTLTVHLNTSIADSQYSSKKCYLKDSL